MLTALVGSLALVCFQNAPPAKTLAVGDPAPVPNIEHWVRGDKPKFFEPGKVYVVEFWATWCGPCRASMPHLSEVYDHYKDKNVVVVGVSDEKLETVSKFLNTDEWKQKARYTLATDPDGSTYADYMKAAGQNGIPTAFIVKDSKVQWIGHPMTMDEPLAQVVAGTWDLPAFKKSFDEQQAASRKQMERSLKIRELRSKNDWAGIMKLIDEDIAAATGMQKTSLQLQKFQLLLTDANDPTAGYALGKELAAANASEPMLLNQMAWFVLDNQKVKERNLDFALNVAEAAAKASGNKDAAILDTLARAQWDKGDKAAAVATQKKAVEIANPDMRDDLSETLKKYQGGDSAATPTTKTSFFPQNTAPKSDTPPGSGGAGGAGGKGGVGGVGGVGGGGAGGAGGMGGSMGGKPELSPSASKAYPAVTSKGFASVDEALTLFKTIGTDPNASARLVAALKGSPDADIAIRVMNAMSQDMQPVAAAVVAKFKRPMQGLINLPEGEELGTFEAVKVDDANVDVFYKDAKGTQVGTPVPMTLMEGSWYLNFDKLMPGGDVSAASGQMAMMANMFGDSMRTATKAAAAQISADVAAGKFASVAEVTRAFQSAMQTEMTKAMGMGGAGGKGGLGGSGGAGGNGAPGGAGGSGGAGGAGGAPTGK